MLPRIQTTIILILVSVLTYAQEVAVESLPDSISIGAVTTTASSTIGLAPTSTNSTKYTLYANPTYGPYSQRLTVSPYFFDHNAGVHRLGNLGGYVTSTSLPGLMGIESGALSYGLQTGNFSFTPALYVNKYGYFGGLTTSLGFGGEMNFQINDRFSLTAFGTYHTNSWASNPAVMSNMLSSRFGGYGTWNINDSWGLSLGAQRVYNSAINQWQTMPIIMPTFKINGKDAIGIDVGGILYQIIDNKRNRGWRGNSNPTIGPPVRPQIVFPPRE